jgi:hypothetical protein
MTARFFWIAFATGLAAIAWVGVGFVGTHALALAMTVAIAAAYLLGAYELRQYRADTASLAAALAQPPAPGAATLGDWLAGVPAALRTAVRLRIEAGSGALPGPALTPYLVGLLVMLGMLGTFLGMVVTFKGAVFALEGSTDLQAIRAALAAPIKGLGLAFGTSVAGVAASAMLGLMSALCRRDRLAVARALDASVATVLRPYSSAHQREEALRAAQAQAVALPQLVDRLDALMANIEQRSQQLDERLLAAQARFQQDAAASYTTLARDVGTALQDSLAAGARAAGESIRPVMEATMAQIAQDQARQEAQRLQAWSQQLPAGRAARRRGRAGGRGGGPPGRIAGRTGHPSGHARCRTGGAAHTAAADGGRGAAGRGRRDHRAAPGDEPAGERDNRSLEERTQLVAAYRCLLQTLHQDGHEQSAAIDRLVASAGERWSAPARSSPRWPPSWRRRSRWRRRWAAACRAGQPGRSLRPWRAAFQRQQRALLEALQRIEAAIAQSMARSDEQLAYYVAQAREVIDL